MSNLIPKSEEKKFESQKDKKDLLSRPIPKTRLPIPKKPKADISRLPTGLSLPSARQRQINPSKNLFNTNPFLVGINSGKKTKKEPKKIYRDTNDDLRNVLDDKDFVKELEKSGIDNEALNIIRERLRKKLNGELEKEQNKIPRYSEIED